MMKISVHTRRREARLKLEGRLEGPWVEELKKAWEEFAAARAGRRVVVDLNAVSYVDAGGRALLAEMHRAGAHLESNLPLTAAVVEEIEQ